MACPRRPDRADADGDPSSSISGPSSSVTRGADDLSPDDDCAILTDSNGSDRMTQPERRQAHTEALQQEVENAQPRTSPAAVAAETPRRPTIFTLSSFSTSPDSDYSELARANSRPVALPDSSMPNRLSQQTGHCVLPHGDPPTHQGTLNMAALAHLDQIESPQPVRPVREWVMQRPLDERVDVPGAPDPRRRPPSMETVSPSDAVTAREFSRIQRREGSQQQASFDQRLRTLQEGLEREEQATLELNAQDEVLSQSSPAPPRRHDHLHPRPTFPIDSPAQLVDGRTDITLPELIEQLRRDLASSALAASAHAAETVQLPSDADQLQSSASSVPVSPLSHLPPARHVPVEIDPINIALREQLAESGHDHSQGVHSDMPLLRDGALRWPNARPTITPAPNGGLGPSSPPNTLSTDAQLTHDNVHRLHHLLPTASDTPLMSPSNGTSRSRNPSSNSSRPMPQLNWRGHRSLSVDNLPRFGETATLALPPLHVLHSEPRQGVGRDSVVGVLNSLAQDVLALEEDTKCDLQRSRTQRWSIGRSMSQ